MMSANGSKNVAKPSFLIEDMHSDEKVNGIELKVPLNNSKRGSIIYDTELKVPTNNARRISIASDSGLNTPKSNSRRVSIAPEWELKVPMSSCRRVSNASDTGKDKPSRQILHRNSTFKDPSLGVNSAFAVRSFRRVSCRLSVDVVKPKQNYENTFKMDPDDEKRFPVGKVEMIIKDILNNLKNDHYDHERCNALACDISNDVKREVKEFNIPRYKIVCNTVIGQNNDQGVRVASRGVCNSAMDNSACVTFKNEHIFAVVMVYGIYFE